MIWNRTILALVIVVATLLLAYQFRSLDLDRDSSPVSEIATHQSEARSGAARSGETGVEARRETVTERPHDAAATGPSVTDPAEMSIHGTVYDPYRKPIDGARVALFRLDPITGETRVVRSMTTGPEGRYAYRVERAGRYRVTAEAQGCQPGSKDFDESAAGRMRARLGDFHLQAAHTTTLTGSLLDRDGTLLSLDEMYFLFPGLAPDPDVEEEVDENVARPFRGTSAIFASHADNVGQLYGRREASLDAATASFTLDIPGDYDGVVYLQHRDQILVQRVIRGDMTRADLTIDMDARRGSLCTLEIRVLNDRTGLPLPESPPDHESWFLDPNVTVVVRRHLDLAYESSSSARWIDPPLLTLHDLPPGRYDILVHSLFLSSAWRSVDLAPGATARELFRLVSPATVRVFVIGWPGNVEELASSLSLSTTGADPVDCAVRAEAVGGSPCLQVEAPVGDVVLFLGGAYVAKTTLVSGPNSDLVMNWRRGVRLSCEIQLYRPPLGQRSNSSHAQVRLLDRDGAILLEKIQGVPIRDDGWAQVEIDATPGDYLLLLDFAGTRRVETPVTLGESEPTRISLPLPP